MKYRIWTDYTGTYRNGEHERQEAIDKAIEWASVWPFGYLHTVRIVDETDMDILRTLPTGR